ncbi:helix-turn-helix domain-containing protein [Nocardia sp. NPDC003963]
MYEALGKVIRERREALGLDQAGLAAQQGVGQQTVSGWERGRSRPRRAMLSDLAQVLAVAEDVLLDVGEYLLPTSAVRLPVRPLTRALPLDELTEERFEDLLTEVMATLHPGGHASRYGGRGHKQYGIDILVAAGGANLATGQCKRVREFGPTAVSKAINEVTVAAPKHYLFLSRLTATPAARKAVAKQTSWELWDGEDISRYIRNLPRERAVRIVDTYFPGHRESFLGVPGPGPWLHPEEYFDATRTTIFNHEWSLVGRQDQLDQLVSAAYQADATLTFVTGAGGVGKTRILKAIAESAPTSAQVRVLAGDTHVSAADFELLPEEGELTIVIDDAHELSEVTGIVAGIWRRNRNAKLVIATRTYGFPMLREGLARHGLLPVMHTMVALDDLDLEAATALAREALGGEAPEAVARQLAVLTTDSPLATVVGGVLIKRGQLEPAALQQDNNIRFHIMRGFRDALVNDPLAYDPPTRRAVLDAVATLQPFRTNETTARESLSEIVGKPYDELHKHLRSLENAGILRRRGESLRIVPDLLGDVILTEAAFDDTNPLGTGYLSRIEPVVTGSSVEHLFINVSRVDWQVRTKHADAPNLADSLWVAFQTQIEAADVIDRGSLANILAKVAYFQPERALKITRWLIDNPTDRFDDNHTAWRFLPKTDYRSVLQALPPVLKLAAMSVGTLPEALAQLWELAQSDERPTNQHPEHALRALRELAAFGLAKPVWFNDQIVDIASTWFVDGQRLSPFEVFEPMLATEGEESSARGHTITFQPYSLNPQSVMPVRQRVIDIAFEELGSSNLRRSGAAAEFLKSAVRYPTGLFGRSVSSGERDEWTPGFVTTIDRLGAIAASNVLDPAVLVSIRHALHWHDNYGVGPAHDAAEHVMQSLPNGVEALLGLTVHDGWGHLVRDRGDNFESIEIKRLELIQAVVDGLSCHTDDQVVDLLITRLRADREVHGPTGGHPSPVVAGLINARPTLAHKVLDNIRAAPSSNDLDSVLSVILNTLAVHEPEAALDAIKELLENSSQERRRAVSQAISWNRRIQELNPRELDLLRRLAADPDLVIRRNAARAAQMLAPTHPAEATSLLAGLRFGDDENLADDIFMLFQSDSGISWDNFSDSELELIRRDLATVDGIGGYWVSLALADRSATDPGWVLGLLQDRVQRAESPDLSREYCALPYSWKSRLRIRGTSEFPAILNHILDWIEQDLDSWRRQKMGADLFAAVANEYDTQVVGLLENALSSGTEKTVRAVAAVLQEAPRTFIWDRPDFVRIALHAAGRIGEEILQDMIGALWGATISGIRRGIPGKPYPETMEQRDRSRDIAENLPTGSIEKLFYTNMAEAANRDILREIGNDLPADGRAW